MCFSAKASFSAAVALSVIGCMTVKKAKTSNELFLACIPLLFAFQQAVEGFLWLAFSFEGSFLRFAEMEKYFYLTFALAIWPVWVPLSLVVLENIPWRKIALYIFLVVGLIYSGIMIANLAYFWPSYAVDVQIIKHSIKYTLPLSNSWPYIYVYGLLTLIPPFISSFKWIWSLGLINILGAAFTTYFFEEQFISVWCFFAAWISLSLYFVIRYHAAVQNESGS